MKTESLKLCEISTRLVFIGFEGENNYTKIVFDGSPIFADYPDAVVSLAIKPPVGNVYPKVALKSGNLITWNVTASDCVNPGDGSYQLTFLDGETVIKSFIGNYTVFDSLTTTGTAPTPIQDWIEEANEALGTITGAVEDAEDARDAAQTAQEKAENAQTAAETAQGLAEAAQTGAETAQGLAEAAQTAAETAQGLAEDARDSAQGYAQDAYEDAERAEQAAGNAGYMFVEINGVGHLIYQRTSQVDADFDLDNVGHLILTGV